MTQACADTDKPAPGVEGRLQALHQQLGIPPAWSAQSKWTVQLEPDDLADAGADCFGRPQRMVPAALSAWRAMQAAAAAQGINLLLVSAFRSVDYQFDLIKRKLDKGQSIEQILMVNAAPGFSEHHTGRAIDLGTDDCLGLTEDFEETPAFRWLQGNARHFNFMLSYPRDNPAGISYEPWHWCFQADNQAAGVGQKIDNQA
jgi:zinc D-Ala-D-Ala carboxypeptidase